METGTLLDEMVLDMGIKRAVNNGTSFGLTG